MKVTRTEWEGERLLGEMVQLVQSTYSDDMAMGDRRGLARFEQAWYEHRLPRRGGGRRLLVAAMATIALVGGGALLLGRSDKLTYEVTNGSIGPGGFVRPTADGTTIVFSEGSEIALGESARTRVDSLTSDGGRVVVESGSVHARIVHRKRARWVVEAGPYTIQVTGTAFNVKWSWTNELLDLQMDRGSVIVTGPLAPAGVTLTTGMRLTANPRSGLSIGGGATATGGPGRKVASTTTRQVALSADEPREDALGPVDFAPPGDVAALTVVERPRGTGGRQKTAASARHGVERRLASGAPGSPTGTSDPFAHPSSEPWDRQLARGNVQGILDDAEARGIDRVLEGSSGRDLSALADAARYGHRPLLARRTLLSMRERFPRSAEAREAAFFLGGLAEDGTGVGTGVSGQAAALEWYDRYLGDSARGRYAAQALGRKMVITQKLKGTEAARSVANQYLDRFPDGPYAPAARKLMRAP